MIFTEVDHVDIAIRELDPTIQNSADTLGAQPAIRPDFPVALARRETTVPSVHPESTFGTPIELVQE